MLNAVNSIYFARDNRDLIVRGSVVLAKANEFVKSFLFVCARLFEPQTNSACESNDQKMKAMVFNVMASSLCTRDTHLRPLQEFIFYFKSVLPPSLDFSSRFHQS